jgi:hypothetical protein
MVRIMKRFAKSIFFLVTLLFPAALLSWLLSSNAEKVLGASYCNPVTVCAIHSVGCIPCRFTFRSGMLSLKLPYQILDWATLFLFVLVYFLLYLAAKKRFHF